jgi:LytS/YehU family sensor histidine kinase
MTRTHPALAMTPPLLAPHAPMNLRHIGRHLLITLVFCCIIATALAVSKGTAFSVQLVYSLATGLPMWVIIEIGRFVLRRDSDIEWPKGMRGVLLVVAGIVGGFVVGTTIGDLYSGFSTWQRFSTGTQVASSLVITILAGATISYYFHTQGTSKAMTARLALIERDAAEARLKLLETQLEPHMLFNTLANLRALIAANPPAAIDMLDRLNDYLRATLSGSRASVHPLAVEFDRLRDYLGLMAVRMGPRLSYTLALPDSLRDCPVPPLLLQPIVENSIKHGLEPRIEGGSIHVSARREGGMLVLEASDTGVGFDSLQPGSKGFGMAQVRERLATAYGHAARTDFSGIPGEGSRTLLYIPCPE